MTGYDKRDEIIGTFRNLWEDHVIWKEAYNASLFSGTENLSYYNQRLYENISDFEKELSKYYSKKDVLMFGVLMQEHFLEGIQFNINYFAGDMEAASRDYMEGYENADELSAYMAKMNPYWDKDILNYLLKEHIFLTANQTALTQAFGTRPSSHSNPVETQIQELADYMSGGIIKQFNINSSTSGNNAF